jgi:ABC-type transport system involved in multi-copper enzyme maturation permease subunit
MTFLPVAQRELMAAARRKSTFRVRMGAATLAALATFLMLVFVSGTGAGQQAGRYVFDVLLGGCHVFAVLAGVLLTADCISEERRDGTLGLLFLTDLGGVDVVAGKFAGLALNAFYAVSAVFPVMAIAWFMGGVSGWELARHALAVLNSMFVCTAAGLMVSAGATRQGRAVSQTLSLLVVLYAVSPVFGSPLFRSGWFAWLGGLRHLSPLSPAFLAGAVSSVNQADSYWIGLATSHAVGWILLLTAAVLLRARWRADEDEAARRQRRRPMDRAMLDSDPVRALMIGDLLRPALPWVVVGVGVVTAWWGSSRGFGGSTSGISFAAFMILALILKAMIVWDATVFLSESRRTGALDLLLTTPLTDRDILNAQDAHLVERYGPPLAILLVLNLVTAFMGSGFGIYYSVVGAVGTILQAVAVLRLAAWYALTERHPLMAFGKAFSFAVLIPTVLIVVCCPTLIIPPLLWAWAGAKLRLPFREVLAGVRSQWQRRDGWMHATSPIIAPPPLPYRRESPRE